MVQLLEKYIDWDLFLLNALVKFLKNSKFHSVSFKSTISNYSSLIYWHYMYNFFILSLKILTGTPGFLFKIKNKRLGNTTIVSEPIKECGQEWGGEWWECQWIFIYNPEFSSRRIKYHLPFKTVFFFGEEKQTMWNKSSVSLIFISKLK